MHFYRVTETDCPSTFTPATAYRVKQTEAHDYAKALAKHKWPDTRVELVDVDTSQLGVCTLLNHADDESKHKVLRTWKLSDRGALRDCANGE